MIEKLSVMAADIDGTLCTKGGTMMPKSRKAIQRLHEQGVLFGPASGRPLDQRILDKAKEWELGFEFDFAIGMNGGELYDKETGQFEKFYMLKKEDVKAILEPVAHLDLNAIVYVNGYSEIAALRLDDFLKDSIKRNHSHVEIGDIDFLSRYDTGKIEFHLKPSIKDEFLKIALEHQTERWSIVSTFENEIHSTLEFLDPHINKGLALHKYSEKHSIPLSEFMAFGDMWKKMELVII